MDYPAHRQHIVNLFAGLSKQLRGPMAAFAKLHKESVSDGALDSKTKELIALGIAICIRCDGCIAYHVHDALKAGASKQELLETIGVAIMMGGGPSMVYGSQALEATEQFLEQVPERLES